MSLCLPLRHAFPEAGRVGLVLVGLCSVACILPARPAFAQGRSCDDGNPCTVDAYIRGLGCVNRTLEGCQPCQTSADCTDPDNNLCTGTYFCDTDAGVCVLNPGTVVTCAAASDDPCTVDDVCSEGQCKGTDSVGVDAACWLSRLGGRRPLHGGRCLPSWAM